MNYSSGLLKIPYGNALQLNSLNDYGTTTEPRCSSGAVLKQYWLVAQVVSSCWPRQVSGRNKFCLFARVIYRYCISLFSFYDYFLIALFRVLGRWCDELDILQIEMFDGMYGRITMVRLMMEQAGNVKAT